MRNKQLRVCVVILLGLCLVAVQAQSAQESPVIKGDYFGQPQPGESAVIFAPGIFSLSDRLESKITFSPDGSEYYFGVTEIKDNKALYKIYYTKRVNNTWTEQVEAPFSVNNGGSSPFMSADGEKLYFNRDRDIWMVERTGEGWGEPQLLPSPINSDSSDGSFVETADNDVYFSSKRPGGSGGMDIWRIRRLPDQIPVAENLGPIMNSSSFDVSPCIAPDGSYFIFG